MLALHLRLARRSLRRTPGFTAVMLGLMTVGIAGWYVPHVYVSAFDRLPVALGPHVYALDPAHDVQLPPLRGAALSLQSRLAPMLLDGATAAAVVGSGIPGRETVTFAASALVGGEGVRVRFCDRDFFALFGFDFAAGGPWPAGTDDALVLSPAAARRFGVGAGDRLRVGDGDLRVAGVLADGREWSQRPYDPGSLEQEAEGVYLPMARAARLGARPELRYDDAAHTSSAYLLYWAELADQAHVEAFLAHLRARLGRPVRLLDAASWRAEVLKNEGSIRAWPMMANLTLLAAALNMMRLLMAKFAGRHLELGLLRSFGARRRSIVLQLLLEAGLIGLAAGLAGTLLGVVCLPLAREAMPPGLEVSAFDLPAVATGLIGALGVALLAAIYPAWRSARPSAAAHLRRA